MKKIILFVALLQTLVFADFKGVDTATLEKMIKKGAPIIDIRTPAEWREGVIPGSHRIMFFNERGQYDINKFLSELSKVVKDKETAFVLVCRTASRTKMVGNFLADRVGYAHVKELRGGIMWGWNNQHKPLEK